MFHTKFPIIASSEFRNVNVKQLNKQLYAADGKFNITVGKWWVILCVYGLFYIGANSMWFLFWSGFAFSIFFPKGAGGLVKNN